MKIAFITDSSPLDINAWSGTIYHVFKEISKRHTVVPLGVGMSMKAYWHHQFANSGSPFYLHDYSPDVCRLLSESIRRGEFDVVMTSVYTMASNLDVDIPLVYFSDIVYILCKDNYFHMTADFEKRAILREGEALRKADKIIFSSQHVKKAAIDFYNLPKEKIEVVDFGANMPAPQNMSIDNVCDDVCHLTFVGRDWKRKGGDKTIEIYKTLRKEGFPCDLTIIGCDPEIDIDGVTIIPFLDKKDANDMARYDEILRSTHFLVLPTKYDAFGIVFCEASAYGVPSITANVGGVGQPVKDGVNGFLLSSNAGAEEYADKIRQTFDNQELYFRLRQCSRKEYETRLNWTVWGDKVSEILEEVVANHEVSCQKECNGDEYYIPVYAINLKSRVDRLRSLQKQFDKKPEFAVTYVEAVEDENGARGLWESICKAVSLAQQKGDDVIVLCEDDHEFTEAYSKDVLLRNIIGAYHQGTELLNCGVGGFGNVVPLSPMRGWVDWFWCTQFVVVFSSMFPKIQNYRFRDNDTADGVLSRLSCHSQVMYPPLSRQKCFGYSDITEHSSQADFQNGIFACANERLKMIFNVYHHYGSEE